MSSRRGSAHLLDPAVDQRPRVVGARAGLRVELHRARTQLRIGEPLDGAVVERLVRRGAVLGRRDREAVVLARDEDAAARALEDRVVRAAVAERELERPEPGGAREQLMAETDAEDTRPADEVAHGRRLVG